MKTITEDYQARMAKTFRPKSHVQIIITSGLEQFAFNDDEIIKAKRIDDVDPIARRLPVHTFEFSIEDFEGEYNPSNPQGKWEGLDENARVTVSFGLERDNGTIEWLSPDVYRLAGKPSVSSGVATFKATSNLALLSKNFYKFQTGSHTFYQIAKDILDEAGFSVYTLSDDLKDYSTDAPIPIDSGQNLLQMVAHATGCTLSVIQGKIKIEPFETSSVSYDGEPITQKEIAMNGDKVSKIEPLYKVQANRYTYSADANTTTLFETIVEVDGTLDYHCEFPAATNVSISSTATITSSTIYVRAADITLSGSGTYTITITGNAYKSSVDISEAFASLDENGGIDIEDNPLVTNETTRTRLLNRVKNYLLLRLTHEISYRGSPELQALDGIYIQSEYTNSNAFILKTEIEYNGAIRGNIIAKAISETTGAYLFDVNNIQVADSTGSEITLIGAENYISDYSYTEMDEFCSEVLGG